MTGARYQAYTRVRASLAACPHGTIGPCESDLLQDCAEGLLLTRDGDIEGREELLDRASLALAMLFGEQSITAAQSERIWAGLVGCGPREAHEASRPSASFSTA